MTWSFFSQRYSRPLRRRPIRRTIRPTLEQLEVRLTPSTTPVDVLDWRGAVPGNNSGVNANETQLTPSTVNPAGFGQLFNDPVDGSIYGEPLVKTNVNINGAMHNVVYVATENDSVYAFDADNPGQPLWHVSFINPAAGINVVPNGDTGSGDIAPEVGISNTMFIDASTNTLYTTSKTKDMESGVAHYVIQLHALDLATGAEKDGGPATIGDTTIGGPDGGYTNNTNVSIPGTGAGSNGTVVNFNALRQNERDGLFEDPTTGLLYLTFTSHGDVEPTHGWILGYDPQTLQLKSVFNTGPNGSDTAIWMGQGMPAMDANGNIFAATGNGPFDAFSAPAPGPKALGPGGGGLGYGPDTPGSNSGGILNSVAIKFDLFQNVSEGTDSTGIFTDGRSPTVRQNGLDPSFPDQSVDMTGSGVNLQSGDPMKVTLSYDGTTLNETITDTLTNASFSTSYKVNIAQIVGSNTAWIGFTGGTGGLTSVQQLQNWTYATDGSTVVDHSGGFASNSDLTANGKASFTGTAAQLTDGGGSEAGSIFANNQVDVTNFTTTFMFTQKPGSNPQADGLTFTIQDAPAMTPGPDYGESVMRLDPTQNSANGNMKVVDSFTPFNYVALNNGDTDQGSGGVLLLPDSVGSAAHPHLMVQAGKDGNLYLLDRDNLGGFNSTTNNVVQEIPGAIAGGLYSTPAYFNGKIYVMGAGDVLKAFSISDGVINPTPVAQTSQVFGFTGASPFITTDGSGDGIVWVLDNHLHGTNGAANGPSVLHAYDANTLQQLYSSSQFSSDTLGGAVKFTVPTVANGKVYVPTQNGLYVFGELTAPRAPVLQVVHTCSQEADLSWTPTANDHYAILESTDGVNFTPIATVASNVSTFSATGLTQPGEYFFEVQAFNQDGSSALSNIAHAFVGEPTVIDDSAGFTDHSDLVANGSATFTGTAAQVTPAQNSQAGSIFSTQKVDIRQFNTSFTFQFAAGTNPIADGMAFVIQGNNSTALGGGGGGLGYSGIGNSVAVTLRAFNPSTDIGLGENGAFDGQVNIPGMDFNAGAQATPPDTYQVNLTYDGTTLNATIKDLTTGVSFTAPAQTINIPALVGGDTAYVGFTGGTGGLNLKSSVLTWNYTPTTQNLPPAAPTNLQVVNVTTHDANRDDTALTWVCNSYNETGFAIQRSTDGVNFTTIATVPANTTSYSDLKVQPGTYYYRVYAFNSNGNSNPTNVDSVLLGAPRQTTTVDHSGGFANNSDLTSNGSNKFVTTGTGTVDELVDGGTSEAGSVFTTSRVLASNFDTTFTFQFHGGTSTQADGMAFVLQGASPTALGGTGGGLGYGSDHPGGPIGITPSVAIKFDLFQNVSEGTDSTGIFTDGRSPTVRDPSLPATPTPLLPDQSVDMTGSGIDLHSGDVFQVHLTYDGTTLNETITDTNTGATFTQAYAVNIPALLGGNVAYAGFTGGTGGDTVIADVQSWTYSFTEPKPGQGGPPTAGGGDATPAPAAALPNASGSAASSASTSSGTSDPATLNSLIQNLTNGGAASSMTPTNSVGSSAGSPSNADGVFSSPQQLSQLSAFFQALKVPSLRKSNGMTD